MSRIIVSCVIGFMVWVGNSGRSVYADIILSGTSYVQDFNLLGSGLPGGVTVRTGATVSGVGVAQSFDSAATSWGITTGQFNNYASSVGLLSNASSADQSASSNRLLGIRQTASFGNPGAAFAFQFADTLGFQDFSLSFESHILSEQGQSTTWTVRWGSGESPTSFTDLGTITQNTFGKIDQAFALGSPFSNSADKKWIQVVALDASTGSGSRDSFGIDNFQLSYSAVPEPTSLMLVGVVAVAGLAGQRWKRRTRRAGGLANRC